MAKASTADNIAANLPDSVRELLFCLASGTDWVKAAVPHATAQVVMALVLIERDYRRSYRRTHEGCAVLNVTSQQVSANKHDVG
jgi:hypothetical protein